MGFGPIELLSVYAPVAPPVASFGPMVRREQLELASITGSGPVLLREQVDVVPTSDTGPVLGVDTLLIAPSTSVGPVSDEFASESILDSYGAVFDHTLAAAPLTSAGPVSDGFLGFSITDSIGPTYDHTLALIPIETHGPTYDAFIGVPAAIINGPSFDHEVMAYIGGIPANGPSYDAYPGKSTSAVGPVYDHIVVAPPPPLDVMVPQDGEVVEVRNRIQPQPVEFKSPYVYRLERDNRGKVTGYKL